MKKNSIFVLVLALLLVFTCSAFAAPTPPIGAKTPLPKEINIVPPGSDVPPELAAFSGIWVGKWSWLWNGNLGNRDSVIIIEKIEGDKVHALFSWGEPRPYYNTPTVGWNRTIGTYSSVTKKISLPFKTPLLPENGNVVISLDQDTLKGYLERGWPGSTDVKATYTKQN